MTNPEHGDPTEEQVKPGKQVGELQMVFTLAPLLQIQSPSLHTHQNG